MATNDDILEQGTVGGSAAGDRLGLIYQQLKIISLLLQQGFSITDDDYSLLSVPAPTLNPPIAQNPNFSGNL